MWLRRECPADRAAKQRPAEDHQRGWADVALVIVGGLLHPLEIVRTGVLIVHAPVHRGGEATDSADRSHR